MRLVVIPLEYLCMIGLWDVLPYSYLVKHEVIAHVMRWEVQSDYSLYMYDSQVKWCLPISLYVDHVGDHL